MKILSLQSAVAYGHVGNSAALFPLQRLGFEVWPINTVQFSNHPGHGGFAGAIQDIAPLVQGLAKLGVLGQCDGVLAGYLGAAGNGAAVLQAAAARQGGALFLCDPVMGDEGGLYVGAGIPDFLRDQAVPAADMLTPNRFELELLSGCPVADLRQAIQASRTLLRRGPRLVVTTSLILPEGVGCLAVTGGGAWLVATPLLSMPYPVNGAGDVLSALVLAHSLRGEPAPHALALAVSSLYGVLEATRASGRRELALVQAQEEIVRPSRMFAAVQV